MVKTNEENWVAVLKDEFEHPAIVLWRAAELREINKAITRNYLKEPILDLGCAEGKIAHALFKDKSLIGLDNSWELLSQNRKFKAYKALVLADGCLMPFKFEIFGSVFSNCVVEHIPALDNLLDEVRRVLKEKGIFIFTVPSHRFGDFLFFSVIFNKLGLKGLAEWYKNKRNKLLNHFHCYDHIRWREILREKGLNLLEYNYYMPGKATFIWDFLAFYVFLLTKLRFKIGRPFFLEKLVRKGYTSEFVNNEAGGALLIVAQKEK